MSFGSFLNITKYCFKEINLARHSTPSVLATTTIFAKGLK